MVSVVTSFACLTTLLFLSMIAGYSRQFVLCGSKNIFYHLSSRRQYVLSTFLQMSNNGNKNSLDVDGLAVDTGFDQSDVNYMRLALRHAQVITL